MPHFTSWLFLLLWLVSMPGLRAQDPYSLEFSALRRLVQQERKRPGSERLPALRALAQFETSACRVLILDLWKGEKDATVRLELLGLLQQHVDPVVGKILSDTLEDTTETSDNRQSAAYGLVAQGPAGLRRLAKAITSSDAVMRSAARQALASAADKPEATKALSRLLAAARGDEAYEILFALRSHKKDTTLARWLRDHLQDKDRKLAIESLRQLADIDPLAARACLAARAAEPDVRNDGRMRGALAYACVVARAEGDIELVLDVAVPGEGWVDYDLGWLAAEQRLALAKDIERVALRRPEATTRLRALALLDTLEQREQLTAAIDLALGDADVDVQQRALVLLRKHAITAAPARIDAMLHNGSDAIRAEAAHILHPARKTDPQWVAYLMAELRTPSSARRMAGLDLLADLRHLPALTAAQEALADPDWHIRSAACRFCVLVRHKSSIPVLIARLPDEHGRLAAEVQAALVGLTGLDYTEARFWEQWWRAAGGAFKLGEVAVAADASARAKPTVTAAATYHDLPVVSDRVCFVIDVSGSMAEKVGTDGVTRLGAASEALLTTLRQLVRTATERARTPGEPTVRHETLVEVVVFADQAQAWSGKLKALDGTALSEVSDFVAALRAGGGTNLHAALRTAFADMAVDTIYLLSDGEPSLGVITHPKALATEIAHWNRSRRVTIHAIGFGTDSELLRQLAIESGGTYLRRR